MAQSFFVPLNRAVLSVSGDDRVTFLQGLVSNDVGKAGPEQAIFAAFLTPQGKFIHDLFIVEKDGALLIDVEAARAEEFRKKLSLYKLKAKVTVALAPDYKVFAILGDSALGLDSAQPGAAKPVGDGIAYTDPRLAALGGRALVTDSAALTAAGLVMGDFSLWDSLRLSLGVPDGSRDLPVDKGILLENGFDELGAVDFNKGCYMGQELTARTKHRGLVRKRLLPVHFDGAAIEPGTAILAGDVDAGEIRSGQDGLALALIRLEHLDKPLTVGGQAIRVDVPSWMVLPEQA